MTTLFFQGVTDRLRAGQRLCTSVFVSATVTGRCSVVAATVVLVLGQSWTFTNAVASLKLIKTPGVASIAVLSKALLRNA